ncbi:tagaturonate reductase [Parapedobacter sp. GCM10030251]|uniref:tagaturonate reductase n=1 Tax=Parapedobacter sp. GCM10030251 TaxID=3273419 RepID=UPI00361B49F1
MNLLNRQLIKENSFPDYPEKVLQFGTGVLLRGLPDYFIEQANRAGLFGGSIVVVKSTDKGNTDQFDRQDNLYTLHIKGLERGRDVQDVLLIAAISRVVSATSDWTTILDSVKNPEVEIVISNTTEVGIMLDERDNPLASPPVSFPGKLTAVLFERFRVFNGAEDKGMVILPTELIDKNGEVLRGIVIALAERHQLGSDFINWVENCNHFCNTLVDRIVPGALGAAEQRQAEDELGYRDELAIMAEPFCLWAIESSHPRVSEVLSFARVDKRVVITADIQKFKELKLRLLNGSHTFACGLAILAGFDTVKTAMADPVFSAYVKHVMHSEIIPALANVGIDEEEASEFANHVIDRFGNPYLQHQWQSISTNYTSKMRMRNLPTIARYMQRYGKVPPYMALGFAGYLKFMQAAEGEELFATWEADLRAYTGFWDAVKQNITQLETRPLLDVINQLNGNEKAR